MFDEEKFEELCDYFQNTDPVIYQLLKEQGYLQPLPPRNLYSTLVGVVIGQRIRYTLARKRRGKLYTLLGTSNFTLEDIQGIDLEEAIGKVSFTKILAINDYIIRELDGLLTVENIDKLLNVTGIGKWSVNASLICYTLGCVDKKEILTTFNHLLVSDLIIRRGMKSLYGNLSRQEMVEIANTWGDFAGYITWYLWKKFT